eukprot:GHVQ01014993.1.p2 GENE.GHVQ01014993.1~~GHVQ01014993.1.p2  ORF type:complete len:209 (+),score=29.65 GHVQ01014993.1:1045-1671(+)
MVKHNNVIPNVHFHKWWQRHVKTWFDQPARKEKRRVARQKKAAALGIRPIGMLRPLVHPPTARYNMKLREGKGFTFEELKVAGVSPKNARTIGISVDHRRRNRCAESLSLNVTRLQTYLSKLVMFPRDPKNPKKGHGGIPADTPRDKIPANLTQVATRLAVPMPKPDTTVQFRAITDEERKQCAYLTIREARRTAKNIGKKKAEEAAA